MLTAQRLLALCLVTAVGAAAADDRYPPARFTDAERLAKLQTAFPAIDRLFSDHATATHVPGMVWGIVIDGELRHVGTFGVQDLRTRTPVSAATVFRIASMTKSFTALAILRLRDQGRLSLEDPVSKWLPEFGQMPLPTRDTAPLVIRQLLSHSAGFPEDNPWGDQQLAATDADLGRWLRQGIPYSTPPGTRYEYSNYAFALLGQIVTRAAGVPYHQFLREALLRKLRMDATTLEFSDVPQARRAIGYRLQPDGSYLEEPPLPQGAFGSMGGLLTSAEDLGRYLAFHLAAWPPRDDADEGPVRRSSVREMSHRWTPSNLSARRLEGALQASERGYGYGLRVASDCRFEHLVGHAGGLPGFGSYMVWLPDYGVGLFAMATLTYSDASPVTSAAWDLLLGSGGLRRRELPASPFLTRLQQPVFELWKHWDDSAARRIGAMNLLLDAPGSQRRAEIEALQREVGECTAAGPLLPENWLRGQFNLSCARGTVGVFVTLAPTQPPAVQHLSFQKLEDPATRLTAPTGAPAGVSCRD